MNMEENGYRFGVGVLVLASVLIGVLLVVFFGAVPQFWVGRYRVIINFPEAPGVDIDTPVRRSGVQIGRVVDVKLIDRNEQGGVNLTLELQNKHKILQRDQCRIRHGSLITGESIVEFLDGNDASLLARYDGAAGTPRDGLLDQDEMVIANSILKDGDYLRGGTVQPDPFGLVVDIQSTLATTLQSVDRAAVRIEGSFENLQEILGGGKGELGGFANDAKEAIKQFKQTTETVNRTAETFNKTAESANRVFEQIERARIPEALAEVMVKLPDIIDEVEQTVQQTRSTVKSFETVGSNFQEVGKTANEALQNIRDFTKPLGGQSNRVIEDVLRTVNNLDALLVDLRRFSNRLNQSQGTIARLVDDEQLYLSLVNTLQNVERLSQRLDPVLRDVRIITDEVARDPGGQLGVRSLFSGRPIGAGVKNSFNLPLR
jgi:phospholipid/cholesterol/gamma-HCH transport system substrate-binding protein